MEAKDFEVAIATSESELREVASLRYAIHVEELGKQPENADHDARLLYEDLDSAAEVLYLRKEGQVVATIRTLYGSDGTIPDEYRKYYSLEMFRDFPESTYCFSSRLMILKAFRGGRLLHEILARSYVQSRLKGAIFNFIGCAPSLLSMYEAMGFRRYKPGIFRTSLGNDFPLVGITDDREHLQRIGSPWAPLSLKFPPGAARTEWMNATFPGYSGPTSCRMTGLDQFLEVLAQHIDIPEVDLFRGINAEDLALLLSASSIVDLKSGDHVVRQGDFGAELFVILDGSAEVLTSRTEQQSLSIESLGRGGVFGEMAFLTSSPRSADVICTSDTRLLAVNRAYLERTVEAKPAAVARLLLNLTEILIQKINLSRNALITAP